MDAVHEARQSRDRSPSNQNAGDPDPCSDFVQQQITGNFKKEVTDKKDSEDQSELLASDGQLFVHGQRGKADVDTVEEGHDKKKKDEGDDPELYFPNDLCI